MKLILAACLLGFVVASPLPFNYDIAADVDEVVEQLKAILITPEGIARVRTQLNLIQSTHPTVIVIKAVLSSMSDNSLIDLVKELSKGIDDRELGDPKPDLLDVVKRGKDLILTEEGITIVRHYIENLDTQNALLVRMKNFIKARTNTQLHESIRRGWKEIFNEDAFLLYSSYSLSLEDLFSHIKIVVNTEHGFQSLKSYLTNLKAEDPYVQIGKAYFLQMDESQMKEVLKETLKNIPDLPEGVQSLGLRHLFTSVKEIILTPEGLQEIREYAVQLKTDNYVVQRLQAALITVDDDTLRDILVDLFQGV